MLSEIFLILRRIYRDIIVYAKTSSSKEIVVVIIIIIIIIIIMKLEDSRNVFEKSLNTKFYQDPCSGSRVPCGQTDAHK
jgi:hypothetical protein